MAATTEVESDSQLPAGCHGEEQLKLPWRMRTAATQSIREMKANYVNQDSKQYRHKNGFDTGFGSFVVNESGRNVSATHKRMVCGFGRDVCKTGTAAAIGPLLRLESGPQS